MEGLWAADARRAMPIVTQGDLEARDRTYRMLGELASE